MSGTPSEPRDEIQDARQRQKSSANASETIRQSVLNRGSDVPEASIRVIGSAKAVFSLGVHVAELRARRSGCGNGIHLMWMHIAHNRNHILKNRNYLRETEVFA
ncbi:MAG: hypothetical protein ACI4P6_07865 [Candidatus Spyradosoma sp.]